MKKRTWAVALAVVALGTALVVGVAPAALAATTETVAEPLGFGARMGVTIHDAGARLVDILADVTGLDVEGIEERRSDGESVADIARSEGVSADTVVEEAIDARSAILDEKVAAGDLDAERRDLMLERMTERLSERVESDEAGPFGRGAGGGQGGGCGAGGGACLATD